MRIFFTVLLGLFALPVFSQMSRVLTDGFNYQPWKNRMYYNAGATGHEKQKSIVIIGNYLPTNNTDDLRKSINNIIAFESPFKSSKSSVGLYATYNTNVSFYRYFSAAASYSYKFTLGYEKFLSWGLQAGVKHVNYTLPWRIEEQEFNNFLKGTMPFVNSGLYFNAKTFYAGVSYKSLLQPVLRTKQPDGGTLSYDSKPGLYVMAGNQFFKDKIVSWQPNMFFSTAGDQTLTINNTLIYKNKYSVGASFYRDRNYSVGLNAGINLNKYLEISALYANERAKTNFEGHIFELMAKIKI